MSLLIDKFDNIKELPHSIILLGSNYSNKDYIAKELAQKFRLRIDTITEDISLDTISMISISQIPTLYIIDNDQISIKNQNMLLKILEEPPKSAYLIIYTSSLADEILLPTVKNRCQIWNIPKYSKAELEAEIPSDIDIRAKDIIINIANNPEEVREYINYPVIDIYDLANKMFTCMGNACFSNVLSLSNKINFDKDYDKYDLKVFCSILLFAIKKQLYEGNNPLSTPIYILTNKLYNSLNILNINKKYLFENYLLNLKLLFAK